MRAIILELPESGAFASRDHTPSCLLRLGDRPFLQHIVESLVPKGVNQFDFVLADSLRQVAACLGDGSRWGCTFHFHLISKAGVGPLLRDLTAGFQGRILVGTADLLPAFGPHLEAVSDSSEEAAVFWKQSAHAVTSGISSNAWSGWALFGSSTALRTRVTRRQSARDDCESWLRFDLPLKRIEFQRQLSVKTPAEVLRSQHDLLDGAFPDLILSGRKLEAGIWLGRNVSIHPSATLTAPVYIGANSRIAAGAHIGPFAVLAEDCIVGVESSVHDALVCPNTYVGQGLEIHQAIIDLNYVIDVKNDTSYKMADHFLLGSLVDDRHVYSLRKLADRLMGVGLLLLFLPLIALIFLFSLREAEPLVSDEVLRIPLNSEEHSWKSVPRYKFRWSPAPGRLRLHHFLTVFLPGLLSVVHGDLSLVGVEPRSAREVAQLDDDWRTLYLKTKAGLVTKSLVDYDSEPALEEVQAAECYYSTTESFTQDLKLLGQYLSKLSSAALESPKQPVPKPKITFESQAPSKSGRA